MTDCVSVQAHHLHSEDLLLGKLVSETADQCPVEKALLVDPDGGEGGLVNLFLEEVEQMNLFYEEGKLVDLFPAVGKPVDLFHEEKELVDLYH